MEMEKDKATQQRRCDHVDAVFFSKLVDSRTNKLRPTTVNSRTNKLRPTTKSNRAGLLGAVRGGNNGGTDTHGEVTGKKRSLAARQATATAGARRVLQGNIQKSLNNDWGKNAQYLRVDLKFLYMF